MGAFDEIRHLVVLMLENQSFDRLLGYLDLGDRTQKIEGVTGTETNPLSPPTDMTPVPVTRISSPSAYVTDPGPGHDFEDVKQQLYADRAPSNTTAPTNAGFVLNYSLQAGSDGRRLGARGRDIMQCLDPALVPSSRPWRGASPSAITGSHRFQGRPGRIVFTCTPKPPRDF
jgi:hypothetical protein